MRNQLLFPSYTGDNTTLRVHFKIHLTNISWYTLFRISALFGKTSRETRATQVFVQPALNYQYILLAPPSPCRRIFTIFNQTRVLCQARVQMTSLTFAIGMASSLECFQDPINQICDMEGVPVFSDGVA